MMQREGEQKMIEERNDMQMDFDEDAQYTERKRILFFGLP